MRGSGDGRKRVTMVKTLGRATERRFWGSWACRDRGEYEGDCVGFGREC